MDVLLLSVSTGSGHIKAAEAIKEGIEKNFPHSRTLIVDIYKYINPIVDRAIVGGYLTMLSIAPRIYGRLYELSERKSSLSKFSMLINGLLSLKIKRLVDEFKPSVIVCTHPFPAQMLSGLKNSGKITIPVVAVLTDFVSHPTWLHKNIDAYVVPHSNVKYEMVNQGVREDIIYPYGIPVSGRFFAKVDRMAILHDLGLENKPTVLIMGGSLGLGDIYNAFRVFLKLKDDIQIIVVAGDNVRLKKQLEIYSGKNVRVLGYTDKVADLMDVSDVIVTKPGGMTIAEALVKRLPIVIMSAIPGQEERNCRFLVSNGAAVRLDDSVLGQVIGNTVMKEMVEQLAMPDACENVVELLQGLGGRGF